jgi:hypothetical protein
MIFWGMGVSQHTHGTDNVRCLIALALMTGQIGRPGTGLHPLRGQNNVQGASDAGLIPMMLPDYGRVADDAVRARFEKLWGAALDPQPGLTVVEILDAANRGEIKGMFILGENPAMSDPDLAHARAGLAALEHLVVQDLFLTETALLADVVLPASSFAEKTGTFTNTDRTVQIGRAAISPPGEARQDLWIVQEIARRLGLDWSYAGPQAVFEEMRRAMPSIAGISWERLEREDAVTYPCRDESDPGQPVIFTERFPTANGRGRFVPAQFRPAAELPDADYPFVLITGRVLEHWHTGAMTRRSEALDALEPAAHIDAHPDDLAALGGRRESSSRWRRGAGSLGAGARRRGTGARHAVHAVLLCRGGGEPADEPGAGSVRENSGIQVLRGEAGPPRRRRSVACRVQRIERVLFPPHARMDDAADLIELGGERGQMRFGHFLQLVVFVQEFEGGLGDAVHLLAEGSYQRRIDLVPGHPLLEIDVQAHVFGEQVVAQQHAELLQLARGHRQVAAIEAFPDSAVQMQQPVVVRDEFLDQFGMELDASLGCWRGSGGRRGVLFFLFLEKAKHDSILLTIGRPARLRITASVSWLFYPNCKQSRSVVEPRSRAAYVGGPGRACRRAAGGGGLRPQGYRLRPVAGAQRLHDDFARFLAQRLEAEPFGQRQHGPVVAQAGELDALQAARPGVTQQIVEERPADALVAQLVRHRDAEFGAREGAGAVLRAHLAAGDGGELGHADQALAVVGAEDDAAVVEAHLRHVVVHGQRRHGAEETPVERDIVQFLEEEALDGLAFAGGERADRDGRGGFHAL